MKKIAGYILSTVAFVLIFLVSGCADNSENQNTVLRVWQTEVDPDAVEVLQEVAQEFERTHPGVRVELESVSWGALSSKLGTSLAANAPPDISHVQPFMVASLVAKDLLVPLDDLIEGLGVEDIYPSVLDLQLFDGQRYGLAYGLGITYFAYRKDVADSLGLTLPATWAEYADFIAKMDAASEGANVLLPGGDPFFIDQLAVELLASNGGRLFDDNGQPAFTERPFIEMLRFYRTLAEHAPSDWLNEKYIDQFRHFATGRGLNVPVTYARAARQIDADALESINDPQHFAVMPQPVGPSGTTSYATLDAEPWVIFKASPNQELAKEFLKLFYQRDFYLRFCKAVPIQLTPIFRSFAESPEYLNDPFIQKWEPWQSQLLEFVDAGRIRPIFIAESSDLLRPYLLELQGSRIMSDLVFAVAKDGADPETAAQEAQKRAEELLARLEEQTLTSR